MRPIIKTISVSVIDDDGHVSLEAVVKPDKQR